MSTEQPYGDRSAVTEVTKRFTDTLIADLAVDAPRMPFKFSAIRDVQGENGDIYQVAVASFSSRNWMFSFETTLQPASNRPWMEISIEVSIPNQETGELQYEPWFRLKAMRDGEISVQATHLIDDYAWFGQFDSTDVTNPEEVKQGLSQPAIKELLTTHRKAKSFYGV